MKADLVHQDRIRHATGPGAVFAGVKAIGKCDFCKWYFYRDVCVLCNNIKYFFTFLHRNAVFGQVVCIFTERFVIHQH